MTEKEYLAHLASELRKKGVADCEEIVSEYEQHFAFKRADGFSEEEIAAKLGSPASVAAQFERGEKEGKEAGSGGFLIRAALGFAALFEAMIYILFLAWVVTLGAAAAASAAVGVCLIGGFNPSGLIPPMPYLSALVFGVSLIAFAFFLAAGTYYFFAYSLQMVRASVRWHKNVLSGGALPPLPWAPQFSGKAKRRLRTVTLWSVTVFGAAIVLAYVISALSAGALEFWHVWNWFV
jgi:uncharacterized membrane protein